MDVAGAGAEDRFAELRSALGSSFDGDGRRVGALGLRRVGVLAGGVLAVAVVVLGASWLRPVSSAGPSGPGPQVLEGASSSSTSTSSVPEAVRVWPDEPVEIDGTEVRTGGHRWTVGAAGDLVAVGDWDCDGTPTPAVLRPSAGQLFVFEGWASDSGELAAVAGPAAPSDAVSFVAGGCGEAIVTTAGGSQVTVPTEGGR